MQHQPANVVLFISAMAAPGGRGGEGEGSSACSRKDGERGGG